MDSASTPPLSADALELERAILDLVMRGAVKVPPYPAVALRLEALVRRNDFGINEVTTLVVSDQALAADVLRCANSPLYRRGDEVSSLQQAITRIGAREVTRIAMASGLSAQARTLGPLHAIKRQIWQDALASAVLAQQLSRHRKLSAESGFACGLLHDFGRMVAASALEEVLGRAPQTAGKPEEFWAQLVERFHVELGALLARSWKLPLLVADVIGHHHDGRPDPSNQEMVAVIRAVDSVVRMLADRAHLSPADLTAAPELRDDAERALLARTAPEIPAFIAAFEGTDAAKSVRSPAPSKLLSKARSTAGSIPFDGEVLVRIGKDHEAYRGVSLSAHQLVISGPSPLRENYLLQLTLSVNPAFSIWGLPKACRLQGGTYLVDVQPYALSPEAQQRWNELLGLGA